MVRLSNALGNLAHDVVSEKHEALEILVGGMFDDFVKAETGENKAAAKRVRKTLMKIIHLCKEYRVEMLELSR